MTRGEMLAILRRGGTLILDGAATEEERKDIKSLIDDKLAVSTFHQGDQYGYHRIVYNESKGNKK